MALRLSPWHGAAAFSDCLVMWVHLKAMRVFVESILRYGVPPKFQSFLVRVGGGKGGQANPKNVAKLRSSLNEMFASSAAFGQSHMETGKGKKSDGDGEGEDGAYFPYVSLSFMPMSVPAQ